MMKKVVHCKLVLTFVRKINLRMNEMNETLKRYVCEKCGGDLREIEDGHYQCPYCRTEFFKEITLPDELVLDLHSANKERSLQKFEDALNEYDRILVSYPDCFDAYWGATLSDYGVQYEKDYDGKMIPTVHRFSEIPVFENKYFKNALWYCQNENELARIKESAAEIEKIRSEIQKTIGSQQPYDIFLCYKETAVDGSGFTPEFYWADELYRRLRGEGYKVFFAKESLPVAKGDYEAHIFPALKSARLMLILTSSVENVESVWVKNEWSRFIRFARENPSEGKRFKVIASGFKPEILPRELKKEQMLNHDSIGWGEQLSKIIEDSFPERRNVTVSEEQSDANEKEIAFLLKRMYAFLDAGNFKSAVEYSERVFNISPDNAEVYLGKLMIELKIKNRKDLKNCKKSFEENESFKQILKYGNEQLQNELLGYLESVKEYIKEEKRVREEKRKRLKKLSIIIVSSICVIVAIWLLVAFNYQKLEYTLNEDGQSYTLSNVDVILKKKIVIPDKYKGKPVTKIGSSAFFFCNSLTSVTIPDSVTSIADKAFYGCSSLTSVTIPDSVTSIGIYAFYRCSSLTSVTIPNSVTAIGDNAFCNCTRLTSVTIPDSVTSIGSYAFHGCSSLTSVVIGNSVKTIGSYAFYSCDSLTSVTIPDSVTSIADSAFSNCDRLASVTIPDSVKTIGSSAFFFCNSLTSVTIPDSVTSIADNAFSNCDRLASVVIGNSVTSIGNWAFYECSSLTSIKYRGTEEQWNAITKGSGWALYTGNYTVTYNYTGE